MDTFDSHRQPVILLVEDNPDDIFFIEHELKKQDDRRKLHVARDGSEALRFLRREPPYEQAPRPNLILLDLKLPKMSGLEVLATLKADETLRSIPVVILTTSDAETDIAASYDEKATSFITKPKNLQDFGRVIEQIDSFWLQVAQLPSQ